MKNSIIFCFSATGNSYMVAKTISEKIGAYILPITNQIPKFNKQTSIGFVFPTYYMGLPGIVEKFVEKLDIDESTYLFAITTSGPMPGDSLAQLNRILIAKNKVLHYGAKIQSVANYIVEYNIQLEKVKNTIEKSKERTEQISEDIINHKNNYTKEKEGIGSKLFHKLYSKKYPLQDQGFKVSDKCTGCGLCEKVCLADNIDISNKKPIFRKKCESCMACIHWCPTKAIQWKNRTQKRNRYHHPDIDVKELILFKKSRINSK